MKDYNYRKDMRINLFSCKDLMSHTETVGDFLFFMKDKLNWEAKRCVRQ